MVAVSLKKKLGVVGAGILFGALEAGGAAMQRDAGVSSVLATTAAALLVLGVVALAARTAVRSREDL